jgi:hypothetical protein
MRKGPNTIIKSTGVHSWRDDGSLDEGKKIRIGNLMYKPFRLGEANASKHSGEHSENIVETNMTVLCRS